MIEPTKRGPMFRWFAWRPVETDDRGWRWLRLIWRQRLYWDVDGRSCRGWRNSVARPRD